jgi:uncharacterized membrane protein YeaQ/YmgE (transglycosylase-associated protein family)
LVGNNVAPDYVGYQVGSTPLPRHKGHCFMILMIIGFIIVSILAGFIARALVPGRDKMSIGQTMLLGAIGSFVGGLLGYVIFGADAEKGAVQAGGIFSSVVGAFLVLVLYKRFGKSAKKA